ncbi:MAG: asparagine synthase (glutamine-hydrolyzing) [Thermodesulfobacteriota bacterium]
MCGCVGFFNLNDKPVDQDSLIKARDVLSHRGPDDAGVWISPNRAVGMAHRRLSIIDLSSAGHQPMVSRDGRYVITYNGEVYNFQELRCVLEGIGYDFYTNSDTEVILNAYSQWGDKCVDRFIGMFTFGIWDARKNGLFLARDRMGIKPLYYYSSGTVFIFASRLSALLVHPACPRDIDQEALGLYLEMGFVPAPWSMLKDVKKLQPGYTLWIDEKGLKNQCYWSLDALPLNTSIERATDDELVEHLDSLLRESVQLRLISDVSLGAFLSGGIDSSVIVALMCQVSTKPVQTFTIGFTEGKYDESMYAHNIANYLGTNHHERIMKSHDLISLLDKNTIHFDEPFADWSSLPTMLVSKFAKEHVTVCLSGDGGDEMFAGYRYYSILSRLRPFYSLPRSISSIVGRTLVNIGDHRLTLLGQSLCQSNLLNSFSFMRSMIKDYGRKTLFKKDVIGIGDLFRERCRNFPTLDDISKACRLDAAYYLPDDILQKVDVASMSVSLEARVPILDHRVVEFAQSLPIRFKQRHGQSKWLLKRVLSRYLPTKLFDRQKGGFGVPIREWFRNELKEMIQDELSPSRIKRFDDLDNDGVQRLLDLHLSGRRDTHPMLWNLMSLLQWDEKIRRTTVN